MTRVGEEGGGIVTVATETGKHHNRGGVGKHDGEPGDKPLEMGRGWEAEGWLHVRIHSEGLSGLRTGESPEPWAPTLGLCTLTWSPESLGYAGALQC